MRRNKEDYKVITEWKEINVNALKISMRHNIPIGLYKKMFAKTKGSREEEVKFWRNACMISYWISGCSMEESAKKFGRSHGSLVNSLNRFDEELLGFAKFGLRKKIAQLNNYAFSIKLDDAEEYQIGDLIVSYNAFFEEEDEATGTVRGWVVDVVGVRGIVESEYLPGGIAEVPVHNYDKNGLSEIINSKL